jgi:hypothetical protein
VVFDSRLEHEAPPVDMSLHTHDLCLDAARGEFLHCVGEFFSLSP